MDKIGDWLNSVPLFGIAAVSFAVGILYGKGLRCLEWETLIAGCLGLAGGAFAWLSAKKQISHQIQVAANSQHKSARRFLQETKAQTAQINHAARALIRPGFRPEKAQIDFLLTTFNANAIPEIPSEIEDAIAEAAIALRQRVHICVNSLMQSRANGKFDQGRTKLTNNQQQILQQINNESHELTQAIESKLNS